MVCLSRPYHFIFFKYCLPEILLGLFLNTSSHLKVPHTILFHIIAAITKVRFPFKISQVVAERQPLKMWNDMVYLGHVQITFYDLWVLHRSENLMAKHGQSLLSCIRFQRSFSFVNCVLKSWHWHWIKIN